MDRNRNKADEVSKGRGIKSLIGNLLIGAYFVCGYLAILYFDTHLGWPMLIRIPAALVAALPILLAGIALGGGGKKP